VKRALLAVLVLALASAGALAAPSHGAPITKQNGKSPAFDTFTSICAVSGFAGYGLCGGDATRFTNVTGKMNAIQPKAGRYNLEFEFGNLTPGVEYRLWSTRDGRAFSEVGRMFASSSGKLEFKLESTAPAGLGFDLNTINGDIPVVTSWWSGQQLVLNADGTLRGAA